MNSIITFFFLLSKSNVQELLAAADMLQLNEVVDGCCEFLCRELHATNALGILRFAEAHNCESLAKSAMNFVQANFPAVNKNALLFKTNYI